MRRPQRRPRRNTALEATLENQPHDKRPCEAKHRVSARIERVTDRNAKLLRTLNYGVTCTMWFPPNSIVWQEPAMPDTQWLGEQEYQKFLYALKQARENQAEIRNLG